MTLKTVIELLGQEIRSTVSIEKLTESELAGLSKNGVTYVELGGSFAETLTLPDNTTAEITFTLPTRQSTFIEGAAFRQFFSNELDDADLMSKVWVNEIVSRITTARDTVLSLSIRYAGESTFTV